MRSNLLSPEEKALLRVQALVKVSAEEVALPEDGGYYDRLHDRIMAALPDAASDANRAAGIGRAGERRAAEDWMPLLTSVMPGRVPSSKKY